MDECDSSDYLRIALEKHGIRLQGDVICIDKIDEYKKSELDLLFVAYKNKNDILKIFQIEAKESYNYDDEIIQIIKKQVGTGFLSFVTVPNRDTSTKIRRLLFIYSKNKQCLFNNILSKYDDYCKGVIL